MIETLSIQDLRNILRRACARASSSSGGFFDVAAGREELKRIENQASSPDFWNDQEAAQKLLQKRTRSGEEDSATGAV